MAKARGLDPGAVLAVASQEGLGGGIGDSGTSFGPFQLQYGGAYPSWAPHASPAASQAWAWSPPGVTYALDQIATVARGKAGKPAIEAIVTRFERPKDPASEIAGAERAYSGEGGKPPGGIVGVADTVASAPGKAVHALTGWVGDLTGWITDNAKLALAYVLLIGVAGALLVTGLKGLGVPTPKAVPPPVVPV